MEVCKKPAVWSRGKRAGQPELHHFGMGVWMMVRSKEVVTKLTQEYPKEIVLERLKELCQTELDRVIEELEGLLPRYRVCVSRRLYNREKVELKRLGVQLSTELSLQRREGLLKYLLKKQLLWTDILKQNAHEPNQNFQLQCRVNGTVKAYKQMTRAQAERLNLMLAAEDSYCRWAPFTAPPLEAQPEQGVDYRELAEPRLESKWCR